MSTPILLHTLKGKLPPALLKQAEKKTVRECDEEQKGHFIAYVDDGKTSYDVQIKIAKSGEVTEMTCECERKTGICAHKAALLLHIAGSLAPFKKKPKVSKANAVQLLLDEVSYPELKGWVAGLLEKNPDLALSFRHYFSGLNHIYTPGEVIKITEDAIRSVVKNKKNIDLSELKKIITLWQQVHAPIMNQFLAAVHDSNQFANFNALFETCIKFNNSIRLNSKKITSYLEDLLKLAGDQICAQPNEALWLQGVKTFIQYAYKPAGEVHAQFIHAVLGQIPLFSEARKTDAVKLVMESFQQHHKKVKDDGRLCLTHLRLVSEMNCFEAYHTAFQPIRWENDYNLELIRQLIDIRKTGLAEKFCKQQIKHNFKEEYNIPYYVLLRLIYGLEGNSKAYLDIAEKLLPYFFSYDDFLTIGESLKSDEERAAWYKKIRAKAMNASSRGSHHANDFLFSDEERKGKFVPMIRHINSTTSLETIIRYFSRMAENQPEDLLMAIFSRAEQDSWYIDPAQKKEEQKNYFPVLVDLIRQHYSPGLIQKAIKKYTTGRYFYRNTFVEMMKDKG